MDQGRPEQGWQAQRRRHRRTIEKEKVKQSDRSSFVNDFHYLIGRPQPPYFRAFWAHRVSWQENLTFIIRNPDFHALKLLVSSILIIGSYV